MWDLVAGYVGQTTVQAREFGHEPGVLTAGIYLDQLAAVRTSNPSLALRRFAITERVAE